MRNMKRQNNNCRRFLDKDEALAKQVTEHAQKFKRIRCCGRVVAETQQLDKCRVSDQDHRLGLRRGRGESQGKEQCRGKGLAHGKKHDLQNNQNQG